MTSDNSFSIIVIDTETTGLDAARHEVIEISAIRLIPNGDGEYNSEQKTWLLKATEPQTIDDAALAINGHKKEDILWLTASGRSKYLQPKEVIADFINWVAEDDRSSMDRVFAGQNPNFDIDMLKALFKRHGFTEQDFPFAVEKGNRIIDTKMLVTFFDICCGRRRKNYSLGQLIKACKVKKGKRAHSAESDTFGTANLLLKLIATVKITVQEQFNDCYNADDQELI